MTGAEPASPLRIGEVSVPGAEGVIGMTLCPGKKGPSTRSARVWNRDLDVDLERIRRWGAEAVVTLVEQWELEELRVGHMGNTVSATGLPWFHLPIVDAQAPDDSFEDRWVESGQRIRAILADGGRVLVHCRGGLGRTGVVAARLLMEFGVPVEEAIRAVREARRHAIETSVQERYLRDLARGPGGVAAAPVPFLAEPWPLAPSRVDLLHFAGCLLGGAVGDALGAPVEFMSLRDIAARFGPAGLDDYAPAFGRLGAITDDTQMTLFTAEGLLDAALASGHPGAEGRLDAERHPDVTRAVHRAYLRWLSTQDGCAPRPEDHAADPCAQSGLLGEPALHFRRAPGNTCLSALRSGTIGTVADHLNMSKGCGGVMRVAPVGLFVRSPGATGGDSDGEAFRIGSDLAAITHGHPSGYLSAGALALMLSRVLAGDGLEAALRNVRRELTRHPGHEECSEALSGALDLWRSDLPLVPETVEQICGCKPGGGGWVGEEALAIAVFCSLAAGRDFSRGVLLAVNHSGDSDSTGAIAGNILGALLGRDAIPTRWLEGLELREVVEGMAERLYSG